MNITLLAETFTPGLGYIESGLSRALARLGADVTVVAMDLLSGYQNANVQETFACAPQLQPLPAGSIHRVDGYSVHVLGHRRQLGYMRMVGLLDKLKLLRPDVIQTFTVGGWMALDATIARLLFGSRLFTGSHRCACTFPVEQLSYSLFSTSRISNLLLRETPGRLTSLFTEKCYAATEDCAMVAARFMGMQRRKVMVQHLGFDAATCHPLNSEGAHAERVAFRRKLGFAADDLVVINTGKLNSQRNGLLLAQAVGHLRAKSLPFRGLFIGCGSQSDAIAACDGCTVLPLMPASQLPAWYRAADIAWWPHPTISIVDSAACGLPLLVGSAIEDQWFLAGNGLRYRQDDPSDLSAKLCEMASRTSRTAMGALSASMMHPAQSWDSLARTRLRDYEAALCRDRSFGIVPVHE